MAVSVRTDRRRSRTRGLLGDSSSCSRYTLTAMTRIERLRVEHYATALGIGTPSPRLSWTVGDAPDNWSQGAYEIEVSSEGRTARVRGLNRSIWSNRLHEAAPTSVHELELIKSPWYPPILRSRTLPGTSPRTLAVRPSEKQRDRPGQSQSSRNQRRLDSLGGDYDRDGSAPPGRLGSVQAVRRDIQSHSGVRCFGDGEHLSKSERWLSDIGRRWRVGDGVYVTAYGLYEAYLNGQKIGEDIFAPGWTSYYARLPYLRCFGDGEHLSKSERWLSDIGRRWRVGDGDRCPVLDSLGGDYDRDGSAPPGRLGSGPHLQPAIFDRCH
jgi:alpha-L-rhamnosidase